MAHVRCLVAITKAPPDAEHLTFTWSLEGASFEPYSLSGNALKALRTAAQNARRTMEDLVTGRLKAAPGAPGNASCQAFAGECYELYGRLFCQGPGQEVKDWLRSLRNTDPIEVFEVVIDNELPWSIPWTFVYEEDPGGRLFPAVANHPDWEPFWGFRYNLGGGRKADPRRRRPFQARPRLLLVTDPREIDANDRQNLQALQNCSEVTLVDNRSDLERTLRAQTFDLIYWFGHATPSALRLGSDDINPEQLYSLLTIAYLEQHGQFARLAFLNACRTAVPNRLDSFLGAISDAGLSGMVGTEQEVINTFAKEFGLDFLRQFLCQGEMIGPLMQRLRRARRPDPLGLLYGVYCPPGLRVLGPQPVPPIQPPAPLAPIPVIQVVMADAHRLGIADDPPLFKATPLPLPPPYVSLASYDAIYRALFAGRDEDVLRFVELLDAPETRIMVLQGESGVGKSSFLRAGVIPYLEDHSIGYRFLRDRSVVGGPIAGPGEAGGITSPVVFIRATNRPLFQLARGLCDYWAHPYSFSSPTLIKGEVKSNTVDLIARLKESLQRSDMRASLRHALDFPTDPGAWTAALQDDPLLLGRILVALRNALPFGLVLVIDQCEEMFTLTDTKADIEARLSTLEVLRRLLGVLGDFKVILSLRTEYHGRLSDGLRHGPREIRGVREYLLTDFSRDQILEAIRRPTSPEPIITDILRTEEVPLQRYKFTYKDGIPELIADQALALRRKRQDSVLPLLQIICSQLYDLLPPSRPNGIAQIGPRELQQIGGVEGGIRRHVEAVVDRLVQRLDTEEAEGFAGTGTDDPSGVANVMLVGAREPTTSARNSFPWMSNKRAFQKLFIRLSLRQADGTLTTDLVPKEALNQKWQGSSPFERVLVLARSEEFRLLRVNSVQVGEQVQESVSLGHDALAPVADAWREDLNRWQQRRRWLAYAALGVAVCLLLGSWAFYTFTKWQQAEDNLYFSRILLARSQLLDNNVKAAEQILAKCSTSRQQWEWRYLQRVCHGDYRTVCPAAGPLHAVAFNSGGPAKYLATAGKDGFLKVWDVKTGRELTCLGSPHRQTILALVFSPDGRRLALAGEDGVVLLSEIVGGTCTFRVIFRSNSTVRCLAFNADGTLLAWGNDAKAIIVWNVKKRAAKTWPARGSNVDRLLGGQPILSVAFHPDGSRLAASSGNTEIYEYPPKRHKRIGEVRIWDLKTGHLNLVLGRATGPVYSVAFSPNGKYLASGNFDAFARVWDLTRAKIENEEPKPLFNFQHNDSVFSVTFSPDSKHLVTAGRDQTVRKWDMDEGPDNIIFRGHTDYVYAVAISSEGNYLASASRDGTLKIWSAKVDPEARTLRQHKTTVVAVAFSKDSKYLASGGLDRFSRVYDTQTWTAEPSLEHPGAVLGVAFNPSDRRSLATACADGGVRLWDWQTKPPAATLIGKHKKAAYSVAFNPKGDYLASANGDGSIKLWNFQTRQEITLQGKGHKGGAYSVAFSMPVGRYLASGGEDGTVRIWDVSKRKWFHTLTGHNGPVTGVAFSPDGNYLASSSKDRTVALWQTGTWRQVGQFVGHTDLVLGVAFSRDSRRLASASDDLNIRVWDVTTRRSVLVWHQGYIVYAVAYSSTGDYLASASGAFAAPNEEEPLPVFGASTLGLLGSPLGSGPLLAASVLFPGRAEVDRALNVIGEVRIWNGAPWREPSCFDNPGQLE